MTDALGTAKTTKAEPSPKTTTTTEVDVTEEKKEKVKEIPVIHDQDFFQHETGDTYDGEFEAKKKDHSVKMHGQGVYTTAEGDIYSANWDLDKIAANNQTSISYNDGAQFEGMLKEGCYSGKGTYTYPDGSVLTGEFSDNCPVGNLELTDPNGHIWLGKADQGFGWFEPVNHFYEFLETTQTRVKRRHKTPDTSNQRSAAATAKSIPSSAKVTLASTNTVKAKSKTTPKKK